MDITTASLNHATVVTLAGRLDGLSSPALEQKLDELAAGGARKIVVDCAPLQYVSSAGLRVFLAGAKKLKAAGGALVFAALPPAVQEVFELSGFTGVLTIHPTVAAATT
ncbi:MAG TPA: STAS domain-containing protein [Opitutus sp.]|nr:STAS domain-containing protein [Opitutus sp.]